MTSVTPKPPDETLRILMIRWLTAQDQWDRAMALELIRLELGL